jgi:hypothetical protein
MSICNEERHSIYIQNTGSYRWYAAKVADEEEDAAWYQLTHKPDILLHQK